jgi:TonB family protein
VSYVADARNILRNGLDVTQTQTDKKLVNDELELLEPFYQYFTKEPTKLGETPDANVTPLTILSKPRASYTDRARSEQVQGKILVAVLFGADGKIDGVMLLSRLGYGLDQNALRAARSITFKPKEVNGKPVSVVKLVEYGFSIY